MIPIETRKSIDRFQGAIAGIALGDAVGSPFDGLPAHTIRQITGGVEGPASRREREYLIMRVKRGERRKTVAKSAGMIHPPGLYNHPAQQALMVAECLLADPEAGGEAFSRLSVAFLKPSARGKFGAHRKPSLAFRASINRVAAGEDWRTAGEEPAGGDAAVRAIPAGLVLRDDPARLAARAAELALVTDRGGGGISAAVAAALLAARFSQSAAPPPPADALGALAESLREAEHASHRAVGDALDPDGPDLGAQRRILEAFLPWASLPAGEDGGKSVLDALTSEARKQGFEVKEASSGFGPVMVAAAAWICLSGVRGPREAVIRAVSLGRSTSALGALTGGLAGALWGREALPADWVDLLWNRAEILRMGELLARPQERGRWEGKLHELELALNARSKELREAVRLEILEQKS